MNNAFLLLCYNQVMRAPPCLAPRPPRSVVLGISLLLSAMLAWGCEDKKRQTEPRPHPRAAVPSPLDNPAGFCRKSCPLKVRCRLGRVAEPLFKQEVVKCHDACLVWIKNQAEEAGALAPCYEHERCSVQRACLAEVQRIVQDRKIPAKMRECIEMCVTLGTCQGDETDCRLRCKTGGVPIFRALIRCGAKRCPELASCVKQVLSVR